MTDSPNRDYNGILLLAEAVEHLCNGLLMITRTLDGVDDNQRVRVITEIGWALGYLQAIEDRVAP